MGAVDKEAAEIYAILGEHGVSKDRCLLSIKKGWINVAVDGKLLFEFNRKDSFHLDERGQRVDDVTYKFKKNGKACTTSVWNEVRDEIKKVLPNVKS